MHRLLKSLKLLKLKKSAKAGFGSPEAWLHPLFAALILGAVVGRSTSVFSSDVAAFTAEDSEVQLHLGVVEGEPPLASRKVTSLAVVVMSKSEATTGAPQQMGPPAPVLSVGALEFDAENSQLGRRLTLRPKVVQLSPNSFEIRGVKLDMRGLWTLRVKLTVGAVERQFSIPVAI